MKATDLKLVPLSHPAVRRKAEEIKEITPEIKALAEKMFVLMQENNGVGLAAPQVGHAIQLVVMEYEPETQSRAESGEHKAERIPRTVLINPKNISSSDTKTEDEEGCLTTPNIYGPVERALEIEIEALNLKGQKIRFKARGFFARVIQHELDHLNGILFLDRVGDPKKLYSYLPKNKKEPPKV